MLPERGHELLLGAVTRIPPSHNSARDSSRSARIVWLVILSPPLSITFLFFHYHLTLALPRQIHTVQGFAGFLYGKQSRHTPLLFLTTFDTSLNTPSSPQNQGV